MTDTVQLRQLLNELQALLQEKKLWDEIPPELEALQSTEPFALDTLKPEQWLQWIFLPRMLQLFEQQAELPQGFSITPYFEEVWKAEADKGDVLALLSSIDKECA